MKIRHDETSPVEEGVHGGVYDLRHGRVVGNARFTSLTDDIGD